MNHSKVYLDYAATTPVDPAVAAAMLPYFDQAFGNPSSIHYFGQQAEAAVESARETTAGILGCKPKEIIFTSGGTESDNLALRGAALAARKSRQADKILISPVEHHAVSKTAAQLAEVFGFELEYLPVDRAGMVHPDEVAKRLDRRAAVVSVIYANNEIGTVNPIAEIGAICQAHGIPFHTDAVQAGAYLPLEAQRLNADLISLGAHKFYGPKGVGALYVRQGTPILPMNTGGSQEMGLRAGTHNVAYIVGFARALEIAQAERQARAQSLLPLRNRLIGAILEEIPDSQLTGHADQRLPNHASFVFKQIDGNMLLAMLDIAGYACSSGSACKTGSPEPSDVLTALGIAPEWALGSLRVTLGKGTTPEHISGFIAALKAQIATLRKSGS